MKFLKLSGLDKVVMITVVIFGLILAVATDTPNDIIFRKVMLFELLYLGLIAVNNIVSGTIFQTPVWYAIDSVLIFMISNSLGASTVVSVVVALLGSTVIWFFKNKVTITRTAIPIMKKGDSIDDYIFWSGPQGQFYTATYAEGETILKLMGVDDSEWTAHSTTEEDT